MTSGREAIERISLVCDTVVATQLRTGDFWPWSWGPALFGCAVLDLARFTGSERHVPWARAWADHHIAHEPVIDQSDRTAPGLVTAGLFARTGPGSCAGVRYRDMSETVADYVRHEPRLVGDTTNHLGPSMIGKLYPRSVWVDSLMMFGLFAARWARQSGDADLLAFAARQPQGYAELLQASTGLWHHSWWARSGRPFPADFWGRGNGWVVTSLPMIMEELIAAGGHEAEVDAAADILDRTSAALLALQRPDGTWGTLLERPSVSESSATSLIGAGWLHAIRLGVLDARYREPARRAVAAVDARIQWRVGRDGLRQWSLPGISGPTIPLPLLPRTGYRLVPQGRDHSYGIAAQVFAALRLAEDDQQG